MTYWRVLTAPPIASRNAPAWRTWSLRLAPYLVTGIVVVVLLRRYPASEIVAEMRGGHALAMLPFGLALPFVVWAPYAACDRVVFEGTVGDVAFRDVARAKAATALLFILGYFFGGGAYAVWIARAVRARAGQAAGAILYIAASDLTAVCAVASASMWLGGADAPHSVRAVATWIFVVQVSLILVAPYNERLRLPPIIAAWRLVPRRRWLVQLAGRVMNTAIIAALTWAAMRAFGIDVPARAVAMYMPIVMLVTSLPINVAGLGPAQAAWLLFLPWASGPQLLAFQVLWHVVSGAGILVRGLPFVRGVLREIEVGAVLKREDIRPG